MFCSKLSRTRWSLIFLIVCCLPGLPDGGIVGAHNGSNHSGQVACRTRLGLLGTGNDWKRRRSMSITKTIRWFLGQRTTMTYDDSPMTLRAHHSGLASVAQGACACAPTKGELRTVCPSNQYPWRIHGAGIYANMTGVYWWDPCYHI